MQYDLIGIGEALVEFAEVEPKQYVQSFAGDVLNTLYYASKLGLRTSFFSTIGTDSYSQDLEAFLAKHQIGASHLLRSTRTNGLYVIRTKTDGEPTFTFYRSDSAARTTFENCTDQQLHFGISDATAIVFSAIALAVLRNVDRLIEAIQALPRKPLVFFDTNVREALWPDLGLLRTRLVQIAPVVDVLSVARADDQKLYGARTHSAIIEHYSGLGYRNIILRDGPNDVRLRFDGKDSIVCTHPVSRVVDATGAGDAYNAAFILGWLRGLPPETCSTLGSSAASQVLGFRGGVVPEFDATQVLSML